MILSVEVFCWNLILLKHSRWHHGKLRTCQICAVCHLSLLYYEDDPQLTMLHILLILLEINKRKEILYMCARYIETYVQGI